MFKPDIPVVPGTTVINKQIADIDSMDFDQIYSKKREFILKVIHSVEDCQLDKCIRIILGANPNVVFDTIGYSKEIQRVYFFTNGEINTQPWDDLNKPVINNKEVLEEITRLLKSDNISDPDYASLYDVGKYLIEYRLFYESIKQKYAGLMENGIDIFHIYIHDFDHKNNTLTISQNYAYFDKLMTFTKKNGDLIIVKDPNQTNSSKNYYRAQELLKNAGPYISELYDKIKKFHFHYDNVSPANSNFTANLHTCGVTLFSSKIDSGDFRIDYATSGVDFNSNSLAVSQAISGNEELIMKKIYVRIDRLPKEIREDIYKLRKKQLEDEKNKTSRAKRKPKENVETGENKEKNKTLKFLSTILPWVKKQKDE